MSNQVPVDLHAVSPLAMSKTAAENWAFLRPQLSAQNCIIVVAGIFIEGWTYQDQVAILIAYSNLIEAEGMYVRDFNTECYLLGPVTYFASLSIIHCNVGPPLLLPNHISMLHPEDGTYHPHFSGPIQSHLGNTAATGAPTDTTPNSGTSGTVTIVKVPRPANAFIKYPQIIGKMWAKETEEVLAHFRTLAAEAKQEHLWKYPDYQYQPRKPSEKKRRMTKKKAMEAELTALQAGKDFGFDPRVNLAPSDVTTQGGRRLSEPSSNPLKQTLSKQDQDAKRKTCKTVNKKSIMQSIHRSHLKDIQFVNEFDTAFLGMAEKYHVNGFADGLGELILEEQASYDDNITAIFNSGNDLRLPPAGDINQFLEGLHNNIHESEYNTEAAFEMLFLASDYDFA